jgi:hypothetical protein
MALSDTAVLGPSIYAGYTEPSAHLSIRSGTESHSWDSSQLWL